MLFNSWDFLVFLPAVVGLYWLIPPKYRTGLLLLASYVFYAWWDVRFLSLIVVSTLVDYVVGRRLGSVESDARRKRLLLVSIVANLGILGFFKYWGFFVTSAASLLTAAGLEANVAVLSVILPVGISFYTFQTMSYSIDVYRRRLEPETDLARFALFVSFFPQLVAGPIERATRLVPQLQRLQETTRADVDWRGSLALIARGLFRKVVIADGVAPIVNEVFASPERYGGVTLAVGVVAFSLQIYGDFAGYTDIARGTSRLFGVDLMVNFSAPYRSRSLTEFWRRWHISLSTWLRDYLYIPLGGNRGNRLATVRNLMITMLLGGLWHGAAWGFVLWGAMHGLYLSIERVWAWHSRRPPVLPVWLVFVVVSVTWVPFRAATLGTALEIWSGLLDPFGGPQLTFAPIAVGLMGLLTMVVDSSDVLGSEDPFRTRPPFVRGMAYGLALVIATLFWPQASSPFIYFQF